MPLIDFKLAVQACPLRRYLNDLGWKPFQTLPSAFRGPCPIHGSSSPSSRSFCVTPDWASWFCHKCKRGGSVFDLHGLLNNMNNYEAALHLCEIWGIEIPQKKEHRRGTINGSA